jgi:hypothetical protein
LQPGLPWLFRSNFAGRDRKGLGGSEPWVYFLLDLGTQAKLGLVIQVKL